MARVRTAWHHALVRLQGRNVWGNVTGPVSCTIAALQQAGWKAPQPDRWGLPEPSGDVHWFEHEPNASLDHEFRELVEEQAALTLWRRAANFVDGKGAEAGVDFTVARRHLAFYTRKGLMGHAAILRKALQGGLWPAARIHEFNSSRSPLCSCCECGEQETLLHRVWGCQANRESEDQDLRASDNLVDRALAQAGECPIFWKRGLPPKAMLQVDEPSALLVPTLVGDQSVWGAGGIYFGDGSGGADTADKRLRRCGFAVLQLFSCTPPFLARGGMSAPLPGRRQTVPRAEIWALLELARRLGAAGATADSVYFTDCDEVLKGFRAGPGARVLSSNADLWAELWRAMALVQCAFTVKRIYRSHVKPWEVAFGLMPIFHYAGNEFADVWAGRAAAIHRVEEGVRRSVQIVDGLTWKVQSRIVAAVRLAQTMTERPKPVVRDQAIRAPARTTESLVSELEALGHKFHIVDTMRIKRRACAKCHALAPDVGLAALLRCGPCVAATVIEDSGSAHLAPVRLPGLVTVGARAVHSSHVLWKSKNVVFCANCAMWARLFPRTLTEQCRGQADSAGRSRLNRLWKGLAPRSDIAWA